MDNILQLKENKEFKGGIVLVSQHMCPADRGADEICPIMFRDGKWQVLELAVYGLFAEWKTKEIFEDDICRYCNLKLPRPE